MPFLTDEELEQLRTAYFKGGYDEGWAVGYKAGDEDGYNRGREEGYVVGLDAGLMVSDN